LTKTSREDREALLKVKVTERSALVQLGASTQQITADAGLVLVRELADRFGLPELLDAITVKKRRRGYAASQQILALCETLIAGGECLDDAAVLRADAAQTTLRGHAVPDPTTLGRFLRGFSLGHIGQLNHGLDALFARVQPLFAREQVTLDLDSTLIEHHGPAGSRQGTRGAYTGKVGWHPLLCFVAETGEWLHAKLRNGHAAASRGARRFLVDCLRRLPEGARLFLRADEGFYGKSFLADCERQGVTYAVGAPLYRALRERVAAIDEGEWQPSSYRAGSEVASLTWQPKTWERERRFVVRRDPVERGEQLSLEGAEWHHWALVTNDGERSADELESWHRDKANVENRIKEAKLGLGLDNLPCEGFHANWAYLLITLLAYNLLTWLKLLALPERERHRYSKRLRFRFIAVAATVGRSGRRLVLRLSASYALFADFARALQHIRGLARARAKPSPPSANDLARPDDGGATSRSARRTRPAPPHRPREPPPTRIDPASARGRGKPAASTAYRRIRVARGREAGPLRGVRGRRSGRRRRTAPSCSACTSRASGSGRCRRGSGPRAGDPRWRRRWPRRSPRRARAPRA
jgi:hypothetical protein